MNIFDQYLTFLSRIDAETSRVSQRLSNELRCGPGCNDCCMSFSVLPLEAAFLAHNLTLNSQTRRQARSAAEISNRCPFLAGGLCLVYAHRPIICRTQGLPIAYVDEEREAVIVSACELNFPADRSSFAEEELLFLDPFNQELAELNSAFAAQRGDKDAIRRIPLRHIASGTGG
ncbi:MAG: YkgJ family cysteine cluster protein [Desulfobacteraceae bacterium]|nr:MAG: YkgJ family cysteine cluster protein [Desulfobacteraceae bacterium]